MTHRRTSAFLGRERLQKQGRLQKQAGLPKPAGLRKAALPLVALLVLALAVVLPAIATAQDEEGWYGEYFAGRYLAGQPAVTRMDPEINFEWGEGAPAPELPADEFAVRWSRYVNFDAGTYLFFTTTDDGVRLYVDDIPVINDWHEHTEVTRSATVQLTAGQHAVRMEMFDSLGNASAKLRWAKAGAMGTATAAATGGTAAPSGTMTAEGTATPTAADAADATARSQTSETPAAAATTVPTGTEAPMTLASATPTPAPMDMVTVTPVPTEARPTEAPAASPTTAPTLPAPTAIAPGRAATEVPTATPLATAMGSRAAGTPTAPATGTRPTPATAANVTYVVQRGDTMRKIAARFNTTIAAIMRANPNIASADRIFIGQRIIIPGGGAQATATPATPNTSQVQIFLVSEGTGQVGCGDELVGVRQDIVSNNEPLRSALDVLLALKDRTYGMSGLYNALYQSDLRIQDITRSGDAWTVQLTGKLRLGGICDAPRVLEQLRRTALQFPTVQEVRFFLDDIPLDRMLGGK